MLYLKRNIDDRLKSWKDSKNRAPLIIRGARQVGKSAAVGQFSKHFSSFVTVDFEISPSFGEVFEMTLEPVKILMQLEVLVNRRIVPGETLLFFDEIQECPRALASLRYFKEKLPQLHVIAAGSLLEFALGEQSFPVGRVDYEHLYPLSFQEFLAATGREVQIPHIPSIDFNTRALDMTETISQQLEKALREYCVVGGMPEAVKVFSLEKSFIEVEKIHDRIIRSIHDDIPKYTNGILQRKNVSNLLRKAAGCCGKQITYTKLHDDDPKRNKVSLHLLSQALYIHIVKAVSAHGLPLGAHTKEKNFKIVFVDLGLAGRLLGRSAQNVLEKSNLSSAFEGQLAEQFVGQQLLAESEGSESGRLYYWKRDQRGASAEVDFILSRKGQIFPVEVKSGKSGSLKSLHILLNSNKELTRGVCLQTRSSVAWTDDVLFAPLYAKI